jgi:hypothetical protein
MQRNIIIALAALVLLLTAALAFVLLRGPSDPMPVSITTADENAAEPYHQEMDCIDRLLQRNDLDANEVEPAFTRCKAGASGHQSAGQ